MVSIYYNCLNFITRVCIIGNYRVNYDEKNWKLIIDYLKTSKYVKIHPVNRAQIIDDLLTLMEFGYLNSNLLFELDEYLKQETDSIPMTRFWNYLFYIYDNFFYRKDGYYDNFMVVLKCSFIFDTYR